MGALTLSVLLSLENPFGDPHFTLRRLDLGRTIGKFGQRQVESGSPGAFRRENPSTSGEIWGQKMTPKTTLARQHFRKKVGISGAEPKKKLQHPLFSRFSNSA
jgi:hypothetical protein